MLFLLVNFCAARTCGDRTKGLMKPHYTIVPSSSTSLSVAIISTGFEYVESTDGVGGGYDRIHLLWVCKCTVQGGGMRTAVGVRGSGFGGKYAVSRCSG